MFKKTLIAAVVLAVSAALIVSCRSTIQTKRESLVTVTIGQDKIAHVEIRPATAWTTLKLFAANLLSVQEARAAIPSFIRTIRLSITAADLTTMTEVKNAVEPVTFTVSVQNGLQRRFVVEGLDFSSMPLYQGEALADLDGTPTSLAITMGVMPGLHVDPAGNDLSGDGSQANPFRTIAKALAASAGQAQAIIVAAGTYTEASTLSLDSGDSLLCYGPNNTSIIDSSASMIISGAENARIAGCRIKVGLSGTGILDNAAAMTISNCYLDGAGSGSYGLDLGGGSLVSYSTVTNFSVSGVSVSGGNSVIEFSSITNAGSGVQIYGGNPTIRNNQITGNSSGVSVAGSMANALIKANEISGNNSGIVVNAGGAAVTGNSVRNNTGYGISVSTNMALSVINDNSMSCNGIADLYSSSSLTINATYNSWDHATPTIESAPSICTTPGIDICYGSFGPAPVFIPSRPAVSGGCP